MLKIQNTSVGFFVIRPTRCTNFTNLFRHENRHVSDSSFRAGTGWNIRSCSKVVYKPVWHIPLLSVQWINSWWWTEELSETCIVSCQNKFVKLAHLVGFITKKFVAMHGHMSRCTVTCHDALSHVTMHSHMSRCTVTCHDARSHERKKKRKISPCIQIAPLFYLQNLRSLS